MPRRRPQPPFRVQIVASPEQEYFRDVVLGARRYGFATGRLVFADRWLAHELEDLPRVVARDGVQGIVAAIHTPEAERRFLRAGVPVVNVSNSMRVPRLPVVTQDDLAIGRLAAEHLCDCGCRAFGFWGQTRRSYSEQRWVGFREALGESALVRRGQSPTGESPRKTYARMRAWLSELPRPAGVFAVLDSYALVLQRAATEAGLSVPEDLAILGAGDDDFFVELERVPLSSIRLPSEKIGYEAGALLDRLLSGDARAGDSLQIPGGELALRRSTDIRHVDDPVVAKAVRLIREQPGIRAAEVARRAGMARTGLQRRFLKSIGRGLRDEIMRVRLARARRQLLSTSAKLEAVAEQCGFASVQRFSAAFRRATGLSPGAYRRERRAPGRG